jgi:outer membrane protein TolC
MIIGFSGARAPRLLASVSALVLLSACALQPRPFTEAELKAQAEADRGKLFAPEAPVTRPLSLADAIARALKYNLDHRTKMLERALALGQTDLDRWDLLPKVTASAGYIGRSDHATTRSRDAVTLQPALSNPFYSLDRDRLTADLGVSWNILDFGVSYYSARENADRVLIAEEHRRKTVHNLIQEVRYDFRRAAAAQVLEPTVRKAVADAEQALADARRVEAAGLKNPAETLRFEKTLLENLRQLELISQELSTAKVELAALINVAPGSDFALDMPADAAMSPTAFSIPLERMEEIAFVNNPDLREQGYLARIAVDETRKTIVRILPGINLSANRQWDSNSFLVDRQWYEAGARMSWNLINLLSMPDQLNQAAANEKVTEARRIALRMAVLAQVHISYRQFVNAERQFERADELYAVENRLARMAKARTENDAQSVLEEIGNQTSAIAATLRRYQSYAQVEQALGRMYATMGQDLLPPSIASTDLDSLSATVASGLDAWSRGKVPNAGEKPPERAAAESKAPTSFFGKARLWLTNGFAPASAASPQEASPLPAAAPAPSTPPASFDGRAPLSDDISRQVSRLVMESGGSSVPKNGQ